MLAGIIISNIVLFTASCLDSNIVTMNSIPQGSGSSQNDPAGGSGLGNSGGGLNLTPKYPKPNCHVCDAISKLHDRLDAKAFDKENILTKKGASHDLTDLQAKALCEAMNSHVGTADHAIIKEHDYPEEAILTKNGMNVPLGGLLDNNHNPTK